MGKKKKPWTDILQETGSHQLTKNTIKGFFLYYKKECIIKQFHNLCKEKNALKAMLMQE